MTMDPALIYEIALREGDPYAAALAAILNGAHAAGDDAADAIAIEKPDC